MTKSYTAKQLLKMPLQEMHVAIESQETHWALQQEPKIRKMLADQWHQFEVGDLQYSHSEGGFMYWSSWHIGEFKTDGKYLYEVEE